MSARRAAARSRFQAPHPEARPAATGRLALRGHVASCSPCGVVGAMTTLAAPGVQALRLRLDAVDRWQFRPDHARLSQSMALRAPRSVDVHARGWALAARLDT
jgi:hypothetical protein